MATRAAIFIPNMDGLSFSRVYCQFDGYPSAMLPALAAHDPSKILAAREIRSITTENIDAFPDAAEPVTTYRTSLPQWADHGYVLDGCGWRHIKQTRY